MIHTNFVHTLPHDLQMDEVRSGADAEAEGWRAAVAERARRDLAEREAALRDRMARERDQQIEVGREPGEGCLFGQGLGMGHAWCSLVEAAWLCPLHSIPPKTGLDPYTYDPQVPMQHPLPAPPVPCRPSFHGWRRRTRQQGRQPVRRQPSERRLQQPAMQLS